MKLIEFINENVMLQKAFAAIPLTFLLYLLLNVIKLFSSPNVGTKQIWFPIDFWLIMFSIETLVPKMNLYTTHCGISLLIYTVLMVSLWIKQHFVNGKRANN